MNCTSTGKRILYAVAVCFIAYAAHAQEVKVTITPPTAAAFSKYVDVPIGTHTGIPEIGIPIHVVRDGSLQMPITLSYHAGGLKVMEQASWVGAGWNLTAGGVITRSIRGYYDELAKVDKAYLVDGGYYNYLYATPDASQPLFGDFGRGDLDGEPDLFFFNFNGYSGKFYFRADATVMLESGQDLLVEPILCSGNCGYEKLQGFIITTPSGDRYHFGKTLDNSTDVDPIEYTSTNIYRRGPSSWHLNKIESADGRDKIKLSYVAEEYSYVNISTATMTSRIPSMNGNGTGTKLIRQVIYGVRLDEIRYNDDLHSVKFLPTGLREDLAKLVGVDELYEVDNTDQSKGAKGLATVQISETTLCKEFAFNYGYFFSNASIGSNFGVGGPSLEIANNLHVDKKRLKLLSVQEKSCNGTIVLPAHKFSYYDENIVPRTLSVSQDNWGYNNGASNEELMPQLSTDNGVTFGLGYYANRAAAWPAMRAGALKSIQYPTGGRVEYIYGPHRTYANRTFDIMTETPAFTLPQVVASKGSVDFLPAIPFTIGPNMVLLVDVKMNGQGAAGSVRINWTGGTNGGAEFTTVGKRYVTLPPGNYSLTAHYSGTMDNWTNNITGVLKAYDRNSWSYNHYGEILVGGLRIEQVKIYDEVTSTPVTTTYSYKDDEENEKGVLFSVPQYIGQIWNKSLSESGLRLGSSTATNNGGFFDAQLGLYSGLPIDYSFSAGSIHPLSTSQGSHIGYSRVKVIQPDGGYSVYNFNTVGENPEQLEAIKVIDKAQKDWDHKKNFPPAPEPLKPNRGELHRVQIYTADSKLLQEKIFKNTYVFNPEGVHGLIVHLMMNNAYGLLTEYMIQQSKKTFQSVTLLNYDVANQAAAPVGTITETFYDSPNHNQPTKESVFEVASWNPSTQVAGKGKILQQQRTTAIADVTIPWCNPLYDAFAVSSVNEAARYNQFKNSGLTSAVAINDDWRNYQYDITQIRKVYVAARKHYNIYHGRNCEISEGTYSSVSTELKAILDMKKIFKVTSPVEVSTWRDGLFLGSSWVTYKMFDNDRKSIGPGEQKLIQTPVPVSPTSTSAFVPMATSNEAITRDSRYKTEASYKFKNGAVSEVVEKNGVRTSYLWDNINNVPIAKIMNASDNQIFYTSFETDGSLTTARSGRRYFPSGMYTIPFTPPSGNTVYKMSYWYWESNTWKYSGELPFSPNIARGNGLDEIRVYPVGGVMQTYTYDIGKGMTSQTDHNGISTFFEYDDLGRLILQRDNDRKITQTYQYIYKTSAQ